MLLVIASIGILCIETLPSLRKYNKGYTDPLLKGQHTPYTTHKPPIIIGPVAVNASNVDDPSYKYTSVTSEAPGPTMDPISQHNTKVRILIYSRPIPLLENIDSFCTCFFTGEFFCRLIVAPNRKMFCKSAWNIVDVLCVLPMWIKYIIMMYNIEMDMEFMPLLFVMMILRVLRICRVLRLARHYTGVKILALALKASSRELGMLMIFVFIVVLIFAVVIYYAEFFEDDTFPTIPDGYWWAIVTLTTVGYGDMYPKSPMGYVVGSLCALTGILATGLPVPIIANNFNIYYTHAKLKDQLRHRKRRRGSTSELSVEGKELVIGVASDPLIIKEQAV